MPFGWTLENHTIHLTLRVKGGGGAMVSFSWHYFFSMKTSFFQASSAFRIFFLPMSETENCLFDIFVPVWYFASRSSPFLNSNVSDFTVVIWLLKSDLIWYFCFSSVFRLCFVLLLFDFDVSNFTDVIFSLFQFCTPSLILFFVLILLSLISLSWYDLTWYYLIF